MDVALEVYYPEIPSVAELAPARCVYVGSANGRCEVFAWDGAGARQVTDRPQGTVTAAVDPAGERVWWFDDDLAGVGRWRVQPFAGGPDADALPGVPPGRAAGLAAALDGTMAVALAGEESTVVHLTGGDPIALPGARQLVDLTPDGRLLAVAGEPDAPDAVTVLDRAGGTVARLAGPLWAMGFAPAGPTRLLLVAGEAHGYRLLLWTPAGPVPTPFRYDSEVAASWYPDGRRLLVRHDRQARSRLVEAHLDTGVERILPTAPGTVLDAGVQPGGDLHHVWTSGDAPPRLRTGSGLRLPGLPAPGGPARPGRAGELWATGPGGPVHALVARPDRPGPHPAVVLLHGGPHEAARDEYDPLVSLLVSIGCAVLRPNYRGSTGYGPAWRSDFSAGVGLTQLEDLDAVWAEAVRTGVVDPDRAAVAGESWGGYLALLAAGLRPDRWRAVAALAPVADYAAATRAATPAVRALDARLFGGDPDQVPDRYARSSPITYAAAVRAPVLLVAGVADPVCPPDQVRAYAAALPAPPRLVWTGTGHEDRRGAERARLLGDVVTFVGTALGGRQVPAGAR
jgi:dienelactone hydrolase